MQIIVNLTDTETKALTYVMTDPQEWTENLLKERARIAMEELIRTETERLISDPNINSIPATKEEIILNAPLYKIKDIYNGTENT